MGAGRCRGVTERGRPCRNLAAGGGAWCGRCRGAPALPAKNPAASPVAAALTPPAAAAADPLDAGVPTWTVGSRSTAAIAGDIDTDPRLLARFAARPGDDETLMAVAGNPSTPPVALGRLAGVFGDAAVGGEVLVRRQVLRNPSCPPEILDGHARRADLDQFTRAAVGQNPACPPAALAHLAEARELFVRIRVAGNPSTPPGVLAEFAASTVPSLSNAARSNPGFVGPVVAHAGLLVD